MWSYIIAYNKCQFVKIPNLNHKIRIRTILDYIGFYYLGTVQVLSNDRLGIGMVQDLTNTRKYCPTNNPPPHRGSLQLGHSRQPKKFIFAMQPYFNPAKLIMKYDPIF